MLQTGQRLMHSLRHAGVRPGAVVNVAAAPGGVLVGSGEATAELPLRTAAHVLVAEY